MLTTDFYCLRSREGNKSICYFKWQEWTAYLQSSGTHQVWEKFSFPVLKAFKLSLETYVNIVWWLEHWKRYQRKHCMIYVSSVNFIIKIFHFLKKIKCNTSKCDWLKRSGANPVYKQLLSAPVSETSWCLLSVITTQDMLWTWSQSLLFPGDCRSTLFPSLGHLQWLWPLIFIYKYICTQAQPWHIGWQKESVTWLFSLD